MNLPYISKNRNKNFERSREHENLQKNHKCTERRAIPGSNAFVPSVVGLIIAGEVVKDLTDADTRAKMKTGGKA